MKTLPPALFALAFLSGMLTGCADLPTSPSTTAEGGEVATLEDLELLIGHDGALEKTNADFDPVYYPIYMYPRMYSPNPNLPNDPRNQARAGFRRAARKWASLLWPTPIASFDGEVRCPREGGEPDVVFNGTPPGLVIVLQLHEEERVMGRGGECVAPGGNYPIPGGSYNPATNTIPAGIVHMNPAAAWLVNGPDGLVETPFTGDDWYYLALHEIGHVLGIGTSVRWVLAFEKVWHDDQTSLSPAVDSICVKHGAMCDHTFHRTFLADSAMLEAISKMTARYDGKLVPLGNRAHMPKCVSNHTARRWRRGPYDIMVPAGGLAHPDRRYESGLPEITKATLSMLQGFKYDEDDMDTYTEPLWLNRSSVGEAQVWHGPTNTTYKVTVEGRECPTPVKRDRTKWTSGAALAGERDTTQRHRMNRSRIVTDSIPILPYRRPEGGNNGAADL